MNNDEKVFVFQVNILEYVKKLMNYFKNISAKQISHIFFAIFLATFTFPIRKIIYNESSFSSGLFSEFTTCFFEINEIFLALAFLFFGIAVIQKHKIAERRQSRKKRKAIQKIIILLLIIFLGAEISTFFSSDTKLAFAGTLNILEIFAVAFFIFASKFSSKEIAKIFIIIALLQGLIGVFQFILKTDLGMQFLGEQQLNVTSAGQAKISIGNTSYLRATGTFLHPNILAGFLVIAFLMAENLEKAWKYLRWVLVVPLLLTFSRTGILALMLGLIFSGDKKRNGIIFLSIILATMLIAILIPDLRNLIGSRLAGGDSFKERIELIGASKDLILNYPLGVGFKNFVLKMPEVIQLPVWQIQPVHNIFLLSANEFGIFSGLSLIAIFWTLFQKFEKTRNIIIAIFVIGMFDHYLLTIHAGQVMLAVVIGVTLTKKTSWVNFKFKI